MTTQDKSIIAENPFLMCTTDKKNFFIFHHFFLLEREKERINLCRIWTIKISSRNGIFLLTKWIWNFSEFPSKRLFLVKKYVCSLWKIVFLQKCFIVYVKRERDVCMRMDLSNEKIMLSFANSHILSTSSSTRVKQQAALWIALETSILDWILECFPPNDWRHKICKWSSQNYRSFANSHLKAVLLNAKIDTRKKRKNFHSDDNKRRNENIIEWENMFFLPLRFSTLIFWWRWWYEIVKLRRRKIEKFFKIPSKIIFISVELEDIFSKNWQIDSSPCFSSLSCFGCRTQMNWTTRNGMTMIMMGKI